MSRLNLFRTGSFLAIVLASTSFARATLITVVDEKTSGDQQAYASKVSATDLINANQSTLAGVNVTGYTPALDTDGWGNNGSYASTPASPDYILNNGSLGADTGGTWWADKQYFTGNAAFDTTDISYSVTYFLNTVLNPHG